MTSQSDPAISTHAECSFDPALYSSLFYSGDFPDESEAKIYEWLIEQFHNIFIDGMKLLHFVKTSTNFQNIRYAIMQVHVEIFVRQNIVLTSVFVIRSYICHKKLRQKLFCGIISKRLVILELKLSL